MIFYSFFWYLPKYTFYKYNDLIKKSFTLKNNLFSFKIYILQICIFEKYKILYIRKLCFFFCFFLHFLNCSHGRFINFLYIFWKAYTHATALNSLMYWFAVTPELPNEGLIDIYCNLFKSYGFLLSIWSSYTLLFVFSFEDGSHLLSTED